MSDELKAHEKPGPIRWMAGHSVAANLVMLMCVVGGFLSLRSVKQEVFPDLEIDVVSVTVPYPGASPEEVEQGIILSVEEAVRGLDGVEEVSSTASEGCATVRVELLLGADIQKLAQDIQNEIDRITTFPEEAEEPQVRIVSHSREVLSVILYGQLKDTVLHELAEQVRDQFLQDPDITQVEVTGVAPLEIGIEIPQENLRRYGITLADVADRLRNASVDLPGGALKTESGEILVRVKERRDYGREFAELPIITTADGSQVLLGQIAAIDDSFQDTDRYATYNGSPAVMVDVYRVGEQTPTQVADAVRRQLDLVKPRLPPGVQTAIHHDMSDVYRQRVELLLRNGALGLVLVLIVLGLFLEARLAFWVMMGIPISFLGSFLFLPAMDVTINMMSLFAYIIALGIVVDDAIVVGENVYRHHQQGMPFPRAAVHGAREVAMPVTFSVLTNIVTFMPIYFVPGTMGKIFKMIPLVVATVFLISLGECLFVLPAHLGRHRERKRRGLAAWLHAKQQAFGRGFTRWVNNGYGPFLAFTIRHRYLTIAAAGSLLVAMLGYGISGRMGFELFPTAESDFSQAELVLPFGSPVSKTEAVMQRLVRGARQVVAESGHPELVEEIIADVGMGGAHTGRVRVALADPDVREKIMSTQEFTNRWREAVGDVAGVEYLNFASDIGGPGGRGRPVAVQLSHRDIDVLERASRELAAVVSTYPGTKDVDDGFQPGKQQLDFAIKPEGKSLGLTARDVATQVRHAFYGAEALRQQRGRNEIKIIIRLPEAERASEQTINELMVRTPAGTYVPLSEVTAVRRGRAYTTIDRRNGRRVVVVSADVTPRSKAGEVLDDLRATALPELLAKYPGLRYSFEGHQADIRESMGSLKVTFVLALLAIYAMLAIPFRSYFQPLVVMVSIPFGIIGAFVGHLLMGYHLCLPSMFGIVALSGVVVNDSLILVDFANRRRRQQGDAATDAVHAAGLSWQARFMIPMALSLGFGLLFATFITLVIVPSLYLGVEDFKRAAGKVRRFLLPAPGEPAPAEPLPPAARDGAGAGS